jgi:hypothetical protein
VSSTNPNGFVAYSFVSVLDRTALLNLLLKCLLVFAVLPVLAAGKGTNCETGAGRGRNSFNSIPILQRNKNLQLFSSEDLHSEWFVKDDRPRNESAWIFGREGMARNRSIGNSQYFANLSEAREGNFSIDRCSGYTSAIYDVNLNECALSNITDGNLRLQNSSFGRSKFLSAEIQRLRRYAGGTYSSVSRSLRLPPLLLGEVSIIPSDANQEHRTDGFRALSPMLWLFFAVWNFAALVFAASAIASGCSFDRWRQGWGWGLLRSIAIPTCIFISWHLIWYALSLIGA